MTRVLAGASDRPRRRTLVLLAALMGIGLAAFVAVLAISGHGLERMGAEEESEIGLSIALLENAYRLETAIGAQAMGLRGYLATHRPEALVPWRSGAAEFAAAASALEGVTTDPGHRAMLGALRALEARHRARGAELVALLERGRDAEARALYLGALEPATAAMVASADALVAAQRAQVTRLQLDFDRVEAEVRAQLTLAALLAIPVMTLLAASIAWRVWWPLEGLASAARALAAGRLDVRVPAGRDDEFGDVATAFNAMADEMERSHRRMDEAIEELRRVDRYRDDFLSMASHELRTPLTSIKGFARLLERGSAGPLTEDQRAHVGRIVANSARLLELVNDLLDSTAIRQGRLELALRPAAYAPVVDEAMAQLQPLARKQGVQLVVGALPEVVPALDPPRIMQVLTNLVSNAIKVTPAGGAVAVRVAVTRDAVLTEVEDTGPGIAPEHLERIFEPFVRVPEGPAGTGLGLSISRAILEGHGGEIGVTSRLGHGARFWFAIPLVRPPA